jgi:hypothetical protein
MQEETLSILRSLKGQVEEIAPALQAARAELRAETVEDVPDGTDYLMGELTMLVVMLTGTDSNVAARELEVLNAMRQVVYGQETASLDSNDYLELCREFLRLHPESRMTVDHLPSSIRLLLSYDQEHGTDYASKARTLFAQFGEALVKADNNEHPMEGIILANFKDVLNREPDDEP